MKDSTREKLEKLSFRFDELNAMMSTENATSDMSLFREWTKEHSEIQPIVDNFRTYQKFLVDRNIEELLCDVEMAEYA